MGVVSVLRPTSIRRNGGREQLVEDQSLLRHPVAGGEFEGN
jgi:hypothetical protein